MQRLQILRRGLTEDFRSADEEMPELQEADSEAAGFGARISSERRRLVRNRFQVGGGAKTQLGGRRKGSCERRHESRAQTGGETRGKQARISGAREIREEGDHGCGQKGG